MSLIGGHTMVEAAYEPTMWAKVFHSVPHVNITFHPVDPRFNPKNELYLESLGIIASVPAAWLITTLVVLLIYLCTRCCDTKSTKKRKSRPMRCCLSFFSLVTCASLAVGFLGNHILHEGIENFERSTRNINNVVDRSQAMAKRYNNVFNNDITKNLNRLYDGPFQRDISEDRSAHFNIIDNCDMIVHNVSAGLEAMDQLRFAIDAVDNQNQAERLTFKYVPNWTEAIEKYRWPTTMVVQSCFVLFCLLLFIGAMIHSRCVLIVFSICGLISIITLWLLASIYIASAVALADFCHQPTPWVQYALGEQLDHEVTEYYLKCKSGISNPFDNFIGKADRSINEIERRVQQISGTARKYYSHMELSPFLDDLERHTADTSQLMSELKKELNCEQVYRSYNTALVSVCDSGLIGLILMFISVALSGLLFTALVWCNSHTWIYFKHKGRYIKVDDQDPYMPLSTIERPRLTAGSAMSGPSGSLMHHQSTLGSTAGGAGYMNRRGNMHTPPQTPPYHGTLNGHQMMSSEKQQPHPHQQQQQAPVLRQQHSTGSVGYGHMGMAHLNHTMGPARTSSTAMMGAGGHGGQMMGPGGGIGSATMGRAPHQHQHQHQVAGSQHAAVPTQSRQGAYQGMDNLPATMTLGRRGHYASLRSGGRIGADNEAPLLGPNTGQYATLSKNVKTLESSDFY